MIGSISVNKERKYSEGTLAFIKKRINMQVKTQRDEIERAELNKLINKRRKEEKRIRKLALSKQQMISLKDDNGEIIKCREQMVTRVREFY